MSKYFDIAVLGRGLAGTSTLHYLLSSSAQETSQIPGRILWVGTNPYVSDGLTCSLNSTAMVALQGIQKGLTPLGDLLHDSYFRTCDFVANHTHLAGIENAKRFHVINSQKSQEKLEQRFSERGSEYNFLGGQKAIVENCLLFSPIKFMRSWHESLKFGACIEDDLIVSVDRCRDGHLITGSSGKRYIAKKVVLATGALGESVFLGKRERAVVPGHYLYWDNIDFNESFVITIDGHNLMYRKEDRTMMLSGTAVKDGIIAPRGEIYDVARKFQKLVPQYTPKSLGLLRVGVRQKGKKRLPECQHLGDGLFQIDSLYKNGYSFCHRLGQDMASMVLRKG